MCYSSVQKSATGVNTDYTQSLGFLWLRLRRSANNLFPQKQRFKSLFIAYAKLHFPLGGSKCVSVFHHYIQRVNGMMVKCQVLEGGFSVHEVKQYKVGFNFQYRKGVNGVMAKCQVLDGGFNVYEVWQCTMGLNFQYRKKVNGVISSARYLMGFQQPQGQLVPFGLCKTSFNFHQYQKRMNGMVVNYLVFCEVSTFMRLGSTKWISTFINTIRIYGLVVKCLEFDGDLIFIVLGSTKWVLTFINTIRMNDVVLNCLVFDEVLTLMGLGSTKCVSTFINTIRQGWRTFFEKWVKFCSCCFSTTSWLTNAHLHQSSV